MIKDLAIIILNYNGSTDTIECLSSIECSVTDYSYDVYVLDNNSIREEKEVIVDYCRDSGFCICSLAEIDLYKCDSRYLILSDVNLGFACGNNAVANRIYSHYRRVLLLNNDTIVEVRFIQNMLNFMNSNGGIRFASCRINEYYDKGVMWNCGGYLRIWGNRCYYATKQLSSYGKYIPAEFITGCALFVDSSLINKYGLFSEKFFFGEEDFNFCWRMKKNHVRGACLTECMVYHKVSASSKRAGTGYGNFAVHFANRIIDMKQFYPPTLWVVWRQCVLLILNCKLIGQKVNTANRKKVMEAIKWYSKKDSITRDDYLLIKKSV